MHFHVYMAEMLSEHFCHTKYIAYDGGFPFSAQPKPPAGFPFPDML